jgi:galactokinase
MEINQLKSSFVERFGGSAADLRIFRAPGRVNLIGEHIDYNGGRVLPAALTLATTLVLRPRSGNIVRLAATDLQDLVSLDLQTLENYRRLPWGNYQAGVLDELAKAGYCLSGCDLLYDDTVPHGSGLSSSAAIEVATAFAMISLAHQQQGLNTPVDLVAAAILAQRAENRYVGGKAGHAILLDCNTLAYRYVPLVLQGCCLIIANTNKPRSLADSKYNERRGECDVALAALQAARPDLSSLCELSPAEFEYYKTRISSDTVRRRAEHAIYENDRVTRSVAALDRGDLASFGKLMVASHNSLRDLYEVTGPELDTMVEEALKITGVLGSRMTGAGFGGCTVSLVTETCAEEFVSEVGATYTGRTGLQPAFYLSGAGDGCCEIV